MSPPGLPLEHAQFGGGIFLFLRFRTHARNRKMSIMYSMGLNFISPPQEKGGGCPPPMRHATRFLFNLLIRFST